MQLGPDTWESKLKVLLGAESNHTMAIRDIVTFKVVFECDKNPSESVVGPVFQQKQLFAGTVHSRSFSACWLWLSQGLAFLLPAASILHTFWPALMY